MNDVNPQFFVQNPQKSLKMKLFEILGVLIVLFFLLFLMYYFFIRKSDPTINISVDKKYENIVLEGQSESITTKKYLSDLGYSMRYDIDKFSVTKFNNQDIFRFKNNERVLLLIEKSEKPDYCSKSSLNISYQSCYDNINDTTNAYYIYNNENTYKVTITYPNTSEYISGVGVRINYMLNTFLIN